MNNADKRAVVRDKMHFFGWDEREVEVDYGDAGEIYCAQQAIDRAFHRTGAQEYLDYMENR